MQIKFDHLSQSKPIKKLKKTSDELIEKLKRMGFRASWTKTSNTHLTLFFLGDQNITKLAQLAYKIGDRLAGFPTFHFYVEKLGFLKGTLFLGCYG